MKKTILRFLNQFVKHLDKNDYRKIYREKVTMPLYLDQVLIGLLLSDGSLEKSSVTSLARLSVMFGSKHIAYLLHLFNLFEPYTDSGVRLIKVYNKKTNTEYNQVGFKTVSLPVFLKYYNMFYIFDKNLNKYVKVVPDNITDLITPVVLAHLIMGDGNLKTKDKIIRIYTNSFSKEQVELLGSAISNKLGIKNKVVHDRNEQYIITISKSELEQIKSLIMPYMHPSMAYKIDFNYDSSGCFKLETHLEDI